LSIRRHFQLVTAEPGASCGDLSIRRHAVARRRGTETPERHQRLHRHVESAVGVAPEFEPEAQRVREVAGNFDPLPDRRRVQPCQRGIIAIARHGKVDRGKFFLEVRAHSGNVRTAGRDETHAPARPHRAAIDGEYRRLRMAIPGQRGNCE
jgi:hypothetical protein